MRAGLCASLFTVWCFPCATAAFSTIQLTDNRAVVRQNAFYSSLWGCAAPTARTTQNCASLNSGRVQHLAPNCFDGNRSTFCQTDAQSATTTSMFVIDLQEPRLVTTVGLMTRADCCQTREDTARVLLANSEAMPESIWGATDCLNPGGGFPASTFRNYSCAGSAPARFVYVALFCATTPCGPLNPAEMTVWGAVQTFPAVMSRVVFNAATSTMSTGQGACGGGGTPQACAANAINGIISPTDYAHTSTTALTTSYVWGRWDTLSNTTSIDRVFFATRNLISATCQPVWHRDAGIQVAVSNDTVSLANTAATPAAALCNANLGGANSGGNLNQGLVAPWNWYGGDCKRLGRYMWFRKLGGPIYNKCDGFTTTAVIGETINAFNFAELQAYSSACPALPNLVVPANTTLVNLAAEGCGLPGAVGAATADTGSRCAQSCATGSGAVQRQRGGPAGAAECRSGEWVGPGGVATGPIICGAVCGAVNASSADPSQCTQTVANASWTSAGASGTIRDWYPQWKVYKGASTAALSYGEMEGRAVVVAGSYLTLVGIATVFALNEPLWVATPQPTQSQTVIADVQLGSNASVAGLTLRVNSSVEPASFYVATLLQTAALLPTAVNISRVTGGVATALLSLTTASCAVLAPAWARVSFSVAGRVLNVTCNGAALGTVTDAPASAIFVGTAGLYHTPNPTRVTAAVNTRATAVPAGTNARFRNVAITRGCDGPSGGCNASLPGETCNMRCPPLTTPWNSGSLVLTCQSNGQWSAPPLICYPSQTATVSQTQTASPSKTLSGTRTPSQTQSVSQTLTASGTPTPSSSQSASSTRTGSATVTPSATVTATHTRSTTQSPTVTQSSSGSGTLTETASSTGTSTLSQLFSVSRTQTFSTTGSQQASGSSSATSSASQGPSSTQTRTASQAPTPSASTTLSASSSQALTATHTQSLSPTQSVSVIMTQTSSLSLTPSATQSFSGTSSASLTTTSSRLTIVTASQAIVASVTQTATPSQVPSVSSSGAATLISTGTLTGTATPSTSSRSSPSSTLASATTAQSLGSTSGPTASQVTSQSPAPASPAPLSVSATGSSALSSSQAMTPALLASESASGTPSAALSSGLSRSVTPSQESTLSLSTSASAAATRTGTESSSPTQASSSSATQSSSAACTPSVSPTASSSTSKSLTQSQTPSFSATRSTTPTQSVTTGLTRTITPSQGSSSSPSQSVSGSGPSTPSSSGTFTQTATPSQTVSLSMTLSQSGMSTPSVTAAVSQSSTDAVSLPSASTTRSPSPSMTLSASSSGVSPFGSATSVGSTALTASMSRPQVLSPTGSSSSASSESAFLTASQAQSPSAFVRGSSEPSLGASGAPTSSLASASSAASALASATTLPSSIPSSSSCALFEVPLNVTVSGIPRSAIVAPSLGVLLRLGVSCALEVPVGSVAITQLANPSGDPQLMAMALSDAVNVQTGNCALLSNTSAAQESVSITVPSPPTVVTLAVAACGVHAGVMGLSFPPQLSAGLAAIGGGNSSNGSALFAAFLAASSAASGVPLRAVSASAPRVGAPVQISSGAAVPASSPTASSPESSVWLAPVVAGIVAAAALVVAGVILLALYRHRKALPTPKTPPAPSEAADKPVVPFVGLSVQEISNPMLVVGANPMLAGGGGSSASEKACVASASAPPLPRTGGSGSDGPPAETESWRSARIAALHRDQLPARSPLAPPPQQKQRAKAGSLDAAAVLPGTSARRATGLKHGSFSTNPRGGQSGSGGGAQKLTDLRVRPAKLSSIVAPRETPTPEPSAVPSAVRSSATLSENLVEPSSFSRGNPVLAPSMEAAVFAVAGVAATATISRPVVDSLSPELEFKTNPLFRSRPRAAAVALAAPLSAHVLATPQAVPESMQPESGAASASEAETLLSPQRAVPADQPPLGLLREFKPNPSFRPRGLSAAARP